MSKYILKRVLLMIPTLIGAGILVFFLMRLIPGDLCEMRLASTGLAVDQEQIDICRENLGMNLPVPIQFLNFLYGFVTFDLGDSMWTGKPITEEIGLRFQFAIPLGAISAIKQDTWLDYAVRIFSIAGIAIPSFWLGIMIILGLLIVTQQITGIPWMPPIQYKPIWVDPVHNISQLIWPAVATGYRYAAVATRMTRSTLLEVLREDYIRGDHHRYRIRVPHRRSRRDGTGVQPERYRQAVRR
jgi:peptide/nickel transport system permease protein